jgi:hypothetical protein
MGGHLIKMHTKRAANHKHFHKVNTRKHSKLNVGNSQYFQ